MGKLELDYQRYRVPESGKFRLSGIRPDDDQAVEQAVAKERVKNNLGKLQDYQEQLYAERKQSLLIVLQAMDTGGKDSTIRRIANDLNPQGCSVAGF